jgi:hypothetical protein
MHIILQRNDDSAIKLLKAEVGHWVIDKKDIKNQIKLITKSKQFAGAITSSGDQLFIPTSNGLRYYIHDMSLSGQPYLTSEINGHKQADLTYKSALALLQYENFEKAD